MIYCCNQAALHSNAKKQKKTQKLTPPRSAVIKQNLPQFTFSWILASPEKQ